MELAQLARLASESGLSVVILLCGVAGLIIVIALVAVFAAPRQDWGDRALKVLWLLLRRRAP